MLRALRFVPLLSLVTLFACSGGASRDATDESAGALEKKEAGTATETLLRCNVFESGGGPDQEVTVKRTGDALTLIELTNIGSTVQRDLSREEWDSHSLKLREEYPGDQNTLVKEGAHSWRNESKSPGWHTFGYADCDIDKT